MTIEERLENMERELGRLKRRNRWLLGAILVVVGGLIVPVLLKTAPLQARAQVPGAVKEVRANRIVLEDGNGKTRAILFADKDVSGLALFDGNEKTRARLTVFKDGGPELTLSDENGKTRANLSVSKDGSPYLTLFDGNDKIRTDLSVIKDGSPSIALFDENGKIRFAAGKTETITPEGKTIAYPESSLIRFGPDGKVIWSAIK